MHDDDVIDRVTRVGSQPPSRAQSESARDRALRMLEHAIEEERHEPRRSSFFRRRTVVATAVGLGVCSVAGVGYAALTAPEKASAGVSCHSDLRLDGSQTIRSLDGRSALTICAESWRSGDVDPGEHQVPPLEACVDPRGGQAIHVFATADTRFCARYSMQSSPTAGTDPADVRFASFSRDLYAMLGQANGCVTEGTMRATIRAALDRNDLVGWTIATSAPFSRADQCAGDPALDSSSRVAYVFPAR